MTFPQRSAIITGSSRGIGVAIAERLADDGVAVLIKYSGDAAPVLIAKIEQAGRKALEHKANVTDSAAVTAMFDATITTFEGVDMTAATYFRGDPC